MLLARERLGVGVVELPGEGERNDRHAVPHVGEGAVVPAAALAKPGAGRVDGERGNGDGEAPLTVVTDGGEYPSRKLIIAGGIGAFTPRKLPLKDADQWFGKGLHDRVLDPQVFKGKRLLIVGGGDSAFDWAVNLQGIARSILMIHRRDGFRAHQATVDQVKELYPPSSVMRPRMETDRRRYLTAMAKLKAAMMLGNEHNTYVEPTIWTIEWARNHYKYPVTRSN